MPGITHFYFDGEELTVKTAQKLRERFPDARIINAYGPTEATVALSAVAVTDEMLTTLKRLPIGYTKADSPTFIIDEEGKKVPNGEQGEIIVSGPAVSKGYMNNPEKTAEAFFEFEGLPAYHTGDVGTMTDEGLLLYGGRMDFRLSLMVIALSWKMSLKTSTSLALSSRLLLSHVITRTTRYKIYWPMSS